MAIWPFNRKKQEDTLPEEAKEFYESGRKERSGMAWLMALGTLIVTVVLALLLFYGGRWVYNRFAGDDEPKNQPTEATKQTQEQSGGSNNNSQPPNANSNSNQQGSSSTSTNQPSSNPPSSNPPTPNQPSAPTTGPSSSEVPDTGPGPGGLQ